MQCPELQPKRSIMFNEIDQICDAIGLERLGAYGNVFWILIGKPVDNIPIESMKTYGFTPLDISLICTDGS